MPPGVTRRQLLRAGAGFALAGGYACESGARDADAPSVPPSSVQAIDVHGHYGAYRRGNALVDAMMSAEAARVVERARMANTEWTIVSPIEGLLPPGEADAVAANAEAARVVARTPGLLQWVILDPRRPQTYEQARAMLSAPFCVGVKIHPEEHEYPIAEHGRALFAFVAQQSGLALVHSGGARSDPDQIVALLDAFPEVACILAHLGNSWDDDPSRQVRAIQRSRHGNIFVDTSSARSVFSGLIEWAVREIGSERIVYGSDSPLYDAPTQRARIDHARIGTRDKTNILRANVARILRERAGLDIAP